MLAHAPRFDRQSKRDFSKTLRQRVNEYFDQKGLKRTGDERMIFKSLVMFSIYFIPYLLIVLGSVTAWQYLLLAVVMGIGVAGIGLTIMHDANHGSLSSKKWVNDLLSHSLNLIGGHAMCWKIQHNVLHHSFTNVHGVDEDLEGGHIMRFTPKEPWKAHHKGQHIYAWFLYSLMTFSWVFLKDFRRVIRYNEMGLLEPQGTTLARSIAFIAISKVVYLGYMVALPLAVGYDWYVVLGSFFLMHMVGGLILAMIFQPAHVMETHDFIDGDTSLIEESYESHQLNTTSNFAPTNKWLTWYCGGLNYQVEHHIFPNVSHIHYPAISKIVERTAEEFKLPYRSVKSFREALSIHQQTLKKLGDPAWV